MALRQIVMEPDQALHKKTRAVERFDDQLAATAQDMLETMHSSDGVGLAAPQVGILRSYFVMHVDQDSYEHSLNNSEQIKHPYLHEKITFELEESKRKLAELTSPLPLDATAEEADWQQLPMALTDHDYIIVNPRIIGKSGERLALEGCLSLPNQYALVRRPAMLAISYQDEHGTEHKMRADGLLAACICHEMDHLHGIMFNQRKESDILRNE